MRVFRDCARSTENAIGHENNMSTISVFCIANSRTQAAQIVEGLLSEGFSNNNISALFPDRSTSRDFAHEKHTRAPEGAVTGVGAGGLMGGTLGWLAGIGSVAIPGVGPLVVAGPIVASLRGVTVGATVGGIAGALIDLGIPEYEAKRYEGKVKAGNILLSVPCMRVCGHARTHQQVELRGRGCDDYRAGRE